MCLYLSEASFERINTSFYTKNGYTLFSLIRLGLLVLDTTLDWIVAGNWWKNGDFYWFWVQIFCIVFAGLVSCHTGMKKDFPTMIHVIFKIFKQAPFFHIEIKP